MIQNQPESFRIARQSFESRDIKTALTRCPMKGEIEADFCLLGVYQSGPPFCFDFDSHEVV